MSTELSFTNESFPVLKNREILGFKSFKNTHVLVFYKNDLYNIFEVFYTEIEKVETFNNLITENPENNTPELRRDTIGNRLMITFTQEAAVAYIDELKYYYEEYRKSPNTVVASLNIDSFLHIVKVRPEIGIDESV